VPDFAEVTEELGQVGVAHRLEAFDELVFA
jgi:hypothetical protein